MRHSPLGTVSRAVAAFALIAVAAHPAAGQAKPSGVGFGLGYTDIGAVIGLGGIGSASASFGARAEHSIKTLPDLNNGVLGIEAGFDYYSWSNSFYSYKYIPFGVTANYHFKLDEPKIDPFLGLGLGYRVISCNFNGLGGSNLCSNSAIYFIGRAGMRYFFQSNMAAYVDAGAGAATFNVGLTFKM